MRQSIGLQGIGVVLLAMAACASPGPVSPSPSDSPPEPGLTLDPSLPAVAALSCGGDERFPPAALQGQGTAEQEADPAAAALRALLDEEVESGNLPATGWHRAMATPTRVLFVGPGTGEDQWSMVALQQDPSGWTVDLYGGCRLAPILADGAVPADFWIDPSVPPPGPAAREISAVIHERSCAGGKAPEDRVLEPIVVMTEQAVVVTVPIRPAPGAHDCSANPEVPIVIRLDAPLGDRLVLDGSVFPPRDARMPPG